MTDTIIPIGSDGFYHPARESEVVALVNYARSNGKKLRCRGATHSVAWSIYTSPVAGDPPNRTLQQSPPPSGDLNLAFDKMRSLDWIDENTGVVEVEPGINLGHDASDPFGVSTLENSFLHQIFNKGWAVDVLGGITHQTVAGFTGTGSAGGSTQYSWDNVTAFRIVDGRGNAEWIEKDHPDFDAVSTSMGLLGVITKIRFQLVPMYNIKGTEFVTPASGPDAPMDLLGPGSETQPSLEDYLKKTPYGRIVWWPQKGAEIIQTWEAERVPATNQNLKPYLQFAPDFGGQTEQVLGSTFFILLGNTSLFTEMALIWRNIPHYFGNLSSMANGFFQRLVWHFGALIVTALVLLIGLFFGIFQGLVRKLFPKIVKAFNPITKTGKETQFHDWYWRSLCMDNTVDDVFLGTEFTEIWLPIGEAQKAMNLYRDMFTKGGPSATGYFSIEVYAGPPTKAWMHPGYTDGSDAYSEGTLRIDVYWFRLNKGTPNVDDGFFEQFWDLLVEHDVPFRLHWGKFVPRYDFPKWAAHYRANLPKFDAFMEAREKRDPDGVFYTRYWQERLSGSAQN